MTTGFKKWKESTTTSLSTRHLGHYKLFIVSDGRDNDLDHSLSNQHILYTINTLLNSTIEEENPPKRWLSSTVFMIERKIQTTLKLISFT